MEIKFKGKNRFGGWSYGIPLLFETDKDKENIILLERHIDKHGLEHEREWLVDRKTIGQYIGFKDCDGVKVYEGDILEENTTFGVVKHLIKWNDNEARFCAYLSEDYWCGIDREWISNKRIIGNTHDDKNKFINEEYRIL